MVKTDKRFQKIVNKRVWDTKHVIMIKIYESTVVWCDKRMRWSEMGRKMCKLYEQCIRQMKLEIGKWMLGPRKEDKVSFSKGTSIKVNMHANVWKLFMHEQEKGYLVCYIWLDRIACSADMVDVTWEMSTNPPFSHSVLHVHGWRLEPIPHQLR